MATLGRDPESLLFLPLDHRRGLVLAGEILPVTEHLGDVVLNRITGLSRGLLQSVAKPGDDCAVIAGIDDVAQLPGILVEIVALVEVAGVKDVFVAIPGYQGSL